MNPHTRLELCAAPELLELRMLGAALDTLLLALRFQHPTLDEPAGQDEPPTLRAARRLVLRARTLRAELRSYRAALRVLLRNPPDDDLPF
jgi:hypothetical protein